MRLRRRAASALAIAGALSLVAASAAALGTGQHAPEIGLRDLNGRNVTIESLAGRVVLVDIWASWCEPCAEEMPVLDRLYQRYRGQGLTVIGVAVDRNIANVRQFLGRHRVSFPIVHDSGRAVAGRYGPRSMPSSYIIDRNGIVRHIHSGYRAGQAQVMERQIRALLAR